MTHANHRSASDVLIELVRGFPNERVSVQDLIDGMGDRSFGFALLLFGLLSAIAIIPGLATITAVPLLFFGLQMLAGYRTPWLPDFIAKRQIGRADLERTLVGGKPYIAYIERICRPRLTFLIGSASERILGLLVFLLAAVIALPGPGTNFPPGMAIVFMSIAIIERDGLMLLAGLVTSAVALYLGWLVLHFFITYALGALGFS
jgi:hypothetical protein